MPIYCYDYLSSTGKQKKGWIGADSIDDAKQDLIQRKVLLTRLREIKQSDCPNLSKQDLAGVTAELSKLLKAGLPLYESLLALEEKYEQHRSHLILLSLCEHIKSGHSLSASMRKYPRSFDPLCCSMVANAEKSGTLIEALDEIALLLKKQRNLQKQIINALIYPGILSLFCFVIIGALLYFVIPSLFELFEGRDLHPFTAFVVSVSQFAIRFKSFIFLASGSFFGLIATSVFHTQTRRYLFDRITKLWGIRSLFFKIAMIRFSRTCGTMLKEGIPMLAALQMTRESVNHPQFAKVLSVVEARVMEGSSMADEFLKTGEFPKLFTRMLAVAEKSGKTSDMLLQISEIYEEELEKTFQQVTTIAQPVILLVLGFIVGIVLLSVLLPLTDVSSFISA